MLKNQKEPKNKKLKSCNSKEMKKKNKVRIEKLYQNPKNNSV